MHQAAAEDGDIALCSCGVAARICRVYTGRQVVNARFAALLQPDAIDTPGYGNRLRDVRTSMTTSVLSRK